MNNNNLFQETYDNSWIKISDSKYLQKSIIFWVDGSE